MSKQSKLSTVHIHAGYSAVFKTTVNSYWKSDLHRSEMRESSNTRKDWGVSQLFPCPESKTFLDILEFCKKVERQKLLSNNLKIRE